jgi:hypothetical protein
VVVFEEGELGITIKRTPSGQARVVKIITDTQSEANGIAVGDVIRVRACCCVLWLWAACVVRLHDA